jgi:hypothetical protein
VNSGRAASRAFHLDINRQPGAISFSRNQFDVITRRYIRDKDRRPLDQAAEFWRFVKSNSSGDIQLGQTHHAVLFDLKFPYENTKNRDFLTELREKFDIHQIYYVVRDVGRIAGRSAPKAGYDQRPATHHPSRRPSDQGHRP